jgi:DNA-binding transcriptional LysR family regulator
MQAVDWDDLRIFLAVARAGRVAAAARSLGVEHSTAARRIAKLEADLGTAMFYRTAGGYQLTEAGARAQALAEDIEARAVDLKGRIRSEAGSLSGRVRIALLDELASAWLAPTLPAFRARYPELALEVVVGIPPMDLSRGEAELAIRTPRPRQHGLAAVKLGRVTTGLYAARKRRRVIVDASSRGLDLLVYVPAWHALQSAAWFQPVLASSRVVLATNSSHVLAAAARADAGIAVLPRFMADRSLTPVSDDLVAHDQWLVMHPEFRRDPKVRAVAAFLREIAATLA